MLLKSRLSKIAKKKCIDKAPTERARLPSALRRQRRRRGPKASDRGAASDAPGRSKKHSNKKLLVTKGIATRSKEATRGAPGITTSNKRTLLVIVPLSPGSGKLA